jgi:glycosyltransferase involved in cell wall biosynthesis
VAAFICAKLRRKPVLVVQHIGLVPYRNPVLRAAMRLGTTVLGRLVLGRAEQVVFISDATRRAFGASVRFRTPPDFLPNGLDAGVFRPVADAERRRLRRSLDVDDDAYVALFVGRFVEKKGLAVLREVAAARPDMTFWFVGWGPLDPAAWRLPNVRAFGALEQAQIVPLYRAADVLALPSVGEGFPLVVQEALGCGTPALVTPETAAGAPAAAPHLLCAEPRPDAVAAGLDRHRAAARAARRAEVAAFAARQWSWEGAVDRYLEHFARLTGERPAASRPPATARAGS